MNAANEVKWESMIDRSVDEVDSTIPIFNKDSIDRANSLIDGAKDIADLMGRVIPEVRKIQGIRPPLLKGLAHSIKKQAKKYDFALGVSDIFQMLVDTKIKKAFYTPSVQISSNGALAGATNLAPVDYTSPLVDLDKSGDVLATLANLAEILRRLRVSPRYNVMTKEQEILIPALTGGDNKAIAEMAYLISECAKFNMPVWCVGRYVTALCDANHYSPVAEWITSKPWDGVSRFSALIDTIQVEPDQRERKTLLIRRWLISAIAAAFSPDGFAAQGVLVFQGAQGIGKTSWLLSLAPRSMVAEGRTLNPGDKDSVKQVIGRWIVELGELDATFKKSDISSLKQFLTASRDELRMPYAEKESRFARRTVFFGSVNDECYLNDSTGNRRFWTIPVQAINFNHGIDMQQLWAEVYTWHKAGESPYPDAHEQALISSGNESHTAMTTVEERIREAFAWESPRHEWNYLSVASVLERLSIFNPGRGDSTRAGQTLAKLTEGRRTKIVNGVKRYPVPPKLAGM
jgi:putative DNA primase/helicase